MSDTVLIVEDNHKLRRLMVLTLEKEGYTVLQAADGVEAEHQFQNHHFDVALMDILLPDTTGIKLLENWVTERPNGCYILCTAYGDVEDAVQAMKIGAFDYLTKPIQAEELKIVIKQALEWQRTREDEQLSHENVAQQNHLHDMVGKSEQMHEVFGLIQRVANQNVTVLLQGESGTGKSRCAQAIHLESDRADEPFVKVNCAAIPSQLLESELFGYQKGAFTGATQNQKGKFEVADGGTLFLDEIGDITMELQAKLLQVTQEKTFYPLGSNEEKKVDVRIIAATNRDLSEMVQKGDFREDLYYRLNIIGIHLPPLRERPDDIPLLAEQVAKQLESEHGRSYTIEQGLMSALTNYSWPGNIRELHNAFSRACVLSVDGKIKIDDFPKEIQDRVDGEEISNVGEDEMIFKDPSLPLPDQLENYEQKAIEDALTKAEGVQSKAAEILGISRQSLLYKIRKYELDIEEE
ncbi:sigma-54-dependent transcriptional regulator [Texcoconibacillus texcoconensis]|uniref:DNA-binding NtrC family response regulator n=1 Tax=Texcoconibacillus texcoconensis TaxID=1095777 RepID=A0A840QPN5_9BACI|nr:sigma-54 dependent transcriptional regulator [Texcoconibacillus texcoconensis]MBB5173319.1 DNA-binding NtrC family response regulator [Texcoconibacillus texcoconensis]